MLKVTSSEYITSVVSLDKLPQAGFPEIAFAGRSNVGKSSLINSLLGRRRLAKTSSTPGKTRMLNFFLVNKNLFFVDLPGYGYAKVAKDLRDRWNNLVEPYLRQREILLGVIHLVDCRRKPTQSDQQLDEWLDFYQVPTLVVLTKADKLSKLKARAALDVARKTLRRDKNQYVLFSAKTNQGKTEIWRWITDRISPFGEERA
ncbi:YihA family ribosome biogenesis GTP-binding protein [bacterium]|nr:YihA family ribosome biogenesis GTP-binding protein [bacterium]